VKLTRSDHSALGRQAGDVLTYILLPLACVVLPYSAGQTLIRAAAQRGWLLHARSEAALRAARRYLEVTDEEDWKARWRLVELMEARDLWLSMLGRRRAVSRGVRALGLPEADDSLVLIGMHWGPSVLALQLFRDAGLRPRFVYRQPAAQKRTAAPFSYVYLRLLVAYIRRNCDGNDIAVPGARKELETATSRPGSPVILLDAPITHTARSTRTPVGSLEADFNRDAPELLVEGKARCVLYALGLDESGHLVLECEPGFVPRSAEELMEAFASLMSRYIARDSAQWRLWHAAEQLFRTPAGAGHAASAGPVASAHHSSGLP